MEAKAESAAPEQVDMAEASSEACKPPSWLKPFNWEAFYAKKRPVPSTYDPVQLQWKLPPCFFTQTSGCCAQPVVPCCCAWSMYACCNPKAQKVSLLETEAWFPKMLGYTNPRCPERLRGIWWMSDNQVNQEVLMTFEDADWIDDSACLKQDYENWTRTPSCFGIILITQNYAKRGKMVIQFSPDKKWIAISNLDCEEGYMIYLPDADEVIANADGTNARGTPEDMVRVDYTADNRPSYEYMVRRVAYKDEESGKIVTTPNFQELQRLVKAGQEVLTSCCPQYCVSSAWTCGKTKPEDYRKINPTQIIRWPTHSEYQKGHDASTALSIL
eukprot:TRINITY_DN7001_c0_g1_i1.p1 TRINITY_DN7001_c0_g1~~TRINITY_DN7001_c0_g1_i1.p1  ORF type:complete len:350 (-),score=62.00 TRINITY_DN7001_c0_g1_i1:560-1546(-)